MRRKKEDYFVIALGLILVVIISLIAIITANFSTDRGNERIATTPSPSAPPLPSPTLGAANSRPPLLYEEEAQEKLIELIKNRRPLSEDDRFAKAKVLSNVPQGEAYGIVYQSRNITIDYTKSADMIQVEILTTNIQAAKNEANIWLRTQGLSQEAICTLPVMFYMNYEVANQIRQTDVVFSPLGNGC
jgi:hypothetical protein